MPKKEQKAAASCCPIDPQSALVTSLNEEITHLICGLRVALEATRSASQHDLALAQENAISELSGGLESALEATKFAAKHNMALAQENDILNDRLRQCELQASAARPAKTTAHTVPDKRWLSYPRTIRYRMPVGTRPEMN